VVTPEEIAELAEKMEQERSVLLGLLDGMSDERAAERPPEGEGEEGWSIKEQLAHLAQMETSYRAWVQRAIVEERPDLSTGTHPDAVAYSMEQAHDHTVTEHIDELKRQRERTREVIASIAPEQYERTAVSPAFGELTVMQWLRSYYRHDRMHQAQIQGETSRYRPRYVSGEEPDRRRRG
jgi:hypothetical protein